MADLDKALAELEDWANEPLPTSPASKKPNDYWLGEFQSEFNTHKGDASCLSQHHIRQLFDLAQDVKGCPMPASMMPSMPR